MIDALKSSRDAGFLPFHDPSDSLFSFPYPAPFEGASPLDEPLRAEPGPDERVTPVTTIILTSLDPT